MGADTQTWEYVLSTNPNSYRHLTNQVSGHLATLRTNTPEVMKGFSDLAKTAMDAGVLDQKTKELIALALGVAAHCDPCIGYHTQALVKLGASRQEIDETLGVAVYMGGGPSLMYAASAIASFEEFQAAASAT